VAPPPTDLQLNRGQTLPLAKTAGQPAPAQEGNRHATARELVRPNRWHWPADHYHRRGAGEIASAVAGLGR